MNDIRIKYIALCMSSKQTEYTYEELQQLTTKELRDVVDKYNPRFVKQVQLTASGGVRRTTMIIERKAS